MNASEVGKSGLALKVTEEMIRYSQWDVLSMHIRQAGRALARHKEKKIFNMLNNTGVVVFDNASPTTAEIGRTTGRNLSGAGNGSMTVEDLYECMLRLLKEALLQISYGSPIGMGNVHQRPSNASSCFGNRQNGR